MSVISDASKRSSNLTATKVQLDLVTKKVYGYLGERRFSGEGLGAEVGGQGLRWGSRSCGGGRGNSIKKLGCEEGKRQRCEENRVASSVSSPTPPPPWERLGCDEMQVRGRQLR